MQTWIGNKTFQAAVKSAGAWCIILVNIVITAFTLDLYGLGTVLTSVVVVGETVGFL